MGTEIGAISGLIELENEFTKELDLSGAALKNFSKETQESLKAVAVAGGLVVAAFTAVGVAAIELGKRGADVNDVSDTLEHFAGGADAANAAMERLRAGTKNTIDDFVLAKDAAHLLSAGVQLTADDFGTLGAAAFVLQNRGLGDTKVMLDLVSDAMVTGRTRALAMALGVVDAGDAEQKYADSLGITKEQLSDTGKVEAKRIEILEILRSAVKDAGTQERDFGEQFEAGKVALTNWLDELGSAIASSPAFAAGLKSAEQALKDAFGGNQEESIKAVVEGIKSAAIVALNFALGMIEAARVVNVAWSAIKSSILLVETLIVGTLAVVVTGIAEVAKAGEAVHIFPEGTAKAVEEVRDSLAATTTALMEQTAEASKGLVGASDFDKTLDHLSGTVMNVRDAIDGASASIDKNNKVVDIAAQNAMKLEALQKQLTSSAVDRQKIEDGLWKIQSKSIEETDKLWEEFFAERTKNEGTSYDASKAQIEQWRNNEIAKLDDSDKNWNEHYTAINTVADEKLKGISMDWDSVKDKSLESLQAVRDRAKATYDEMLYGSQTFSRTALQEQLNKWRESRDAVRDFGHEGTKAQDDLKKATEEATLKLIEQKKAIDAAAAANRAMGNSTEVDTTTQAGRDRIDPKIRVWLEAGYSLAQAAAIAYAMMVGRAVDPNDPMFRTKGPREPGFAEGGMVDIKTGEHGPETVRVPLGSIVYPGGSAPGRGSVTHIWNVRAGTPEEQAREIKDILLRDQTVNHLFGSM